jgi:hypothetical protein
VVAYADTLGQLCLCLDSPQTDVSWLSAG